MTRQPSQKLFLTIWKNKMYNVVGQSHDITDSLLDAVDAGFEASVCPDNLGGKGDFEIIEIDLVEGTSRYASEDAAREWYNLRCHGYLDAACEAPKFIQDNLPYLDELIAESQASENVFDQHNTLDKRLQGTR